MYAMDALREAAKNSGTALMNIGVSMGYSKQYVNAIITRGSTPKADTLAKMLGVCGYSLVAISSDQVSDDMLVID